MVGRLIAYALDSNPETRPTMADILAHPYIADTDEFSCCGAAWMEQRNPLASSLGPLIIVRHQLTHRGGRISLICVGNVGVGKDVCHGRGGQRISLFHPGGAAAAELPGIEESEDDWNFSTTDGFERRLRSSTENFSYMSFSGAMSVGLNDFSISANEAAISSRSMTENLRSNPSVVLKFHST
jgi:hypothetical protein